MRAIVGTYLDYPEIAAFPITAVRRRCRPLAAFAAAINFVNGREPHLSSTWPFTRSRSGLRYIDVMVAASQLRSGMIIRFNSTLCQVLVPRNRGRVVLVTLKNLFTGESMRQRFRTEAELEEVLAEKETMSYLFEDADQYWFMNTRTFDQIALSKGLIGKRRPFLQEGVTLEVAFVDSSAVSVAFKKAIDARIAFTFPPDRDQSAYKCARLENGVEVSVPVFIEAGDTVSVDLDLLCAIRPLSRTNK